MIPRFLNCQVELDSFVVTGILFYSCTVNLLPNEAYLAVGVASVILVAITLNQVRKAEPK